MFVLAIPVDESGNEIAIAEAELPNISKGEIRERWISGVSAVLFQGVLFFFLLLVPGGGSGHGGTAGNGNTVALGQLDGEQITNTDDGNLDDSPASVRGETDAESINANDLGVAQSLDGTEGIELSIGGGGGGGGSDNDGFGFGGRSGKGGGEATFLGTSSRGNRFCIIADNSSSMTGTPLAYVKDEILKTIGNARGTARFTVVFFNSVAELPPKQKWISGKAELAALANWVNSIPARGGTSPAEGFKAAMNLEPPPDVIYLMTDGGFASGEVQTIDALNKGLKKPAQVHTIAFLNAAGESALQKIAKDGKGTYRFVPGFRNP